MYFSGSGLCQISCQHKIRRCFVCHCQDNFCPASQFVVWRLEEDELTSLVKPICYLQPLQASRQQSAKILFTELQSRPNWRMEGNIGNFWYFVGFINIFLRMILADFICGGARLPLPMYILWADVVLYMLHINHWCIPALWCALEFTSGGRKMGR